MRLADAEAISFATTGASTKEIWGGWKSVTMVRRGEHASEERDALFAQAFNPFTNGGNVALIAPTETRTVNLAVPLEEVE